MCSKNDSFGRGCFEGVFVPINQQKQHSSNCSKKAIKAVELKVSGNKDELHLAYNCLRSFEAQGGATTTNHHRPIYSIMKHPPLEQEKLYSSSSQI